MSDFAEIERAAQQAGLALRGGFNLDASERNGPLAEARAVLMFGMAGGRQWPIFAASPEASDGLPHPLDRWSRRVMSALAARFAATPLYPFEGPPYLPFQQWARRAEPVYPSPLGLLIHADYGLAHSYRGALAFAEHFKFAPLPDRAHPCEACLDRPCLSACPVGAFSATGYDVAACAAFLANPGGGRCLDDGCQARRACPVGRDDAQSPAQAGFHTAAFRAARAPLTAAS